MSLRLLLILSFALSACSTLQPQIDPGNTAAHAVNVNGFAAGPVWGASTGTSFAVIPSPTTGNPLFAQEVKEKTERLLLQDGYEIVPRQEADFLVFTLFGIGPPETSGDERVGLESFPQLSLTRHIPEETGEHFRWLVIGVAEAAPFRASEEMPDSIPWVWIGETDSTGPRTDLRYMMDFLLVPTFEWFGANTQQRLDRLVAVNDPRVKRLKNPVSISPTSPSMESLGTLQLEGVIQYPNGSPAPAANVTWQSANALVATIDSAGLVQARADGETNILLRATLTKTGREHVGVTQLSIEQVPARLLKVRGDEQSAGTGQTLPVDPTVRVVDAAGIPAPGVEVVWEVFQGEGSISEQETMTDAEGEASTSWTLGNHPGAQALTAMAGEVRVVFTANNH